MLTPLLAQPGNAEVASQELFTAVGSLPRYGASTTEELGPGYVRPDETFWSTQNETSGTAVLFPELRQLWQFYEYGFTPARTRVLVRDLDTFRVLARLDLPGLKRSAFGPVGAADWLHAVDPGRRVFFAAGDNSSVLVVDLRDFSSRVIPLPQSTRVGAQSIGGLAYDPRENRLLLAFGAPAGGFLVASTSALLYAMDLVSGTTSPPRRVRACDAGLPAPDGYGDTASLLYVTDQWVFLHCQRAGAVSAIVRLARADLLSNTGLEDFVTGPTNADNTLLDPASGRIFNMTGQGAIWVFDTREMAYVGTVAGHPDGKNDNPKLGYGVDETTGRVYFLAPVYGLGVLEGRLFPVPQARSDRALAAKGMHRILVDPPTGRIFVMPMKGTGYTIYRPPPAVPAPPNPNPDIGTVNRAEQPGVTDSSFNASASGYGARVLMSKGVVPLFPMPGLGGGDLNPGRVFTDRLKTPCSFSDRDLFAGRVSKTEADTGSTAAAAIAADVDGRTKLDLEQPSRCDASVNDTNGNPVIRNVFGTVPGAPGALDGTVGPAARWTREPAACSSSVGENAKTGAPNDGGSPPLGSSGVSCAVPDGKNVVSAQAQASLTGQALTVGRSASWTEIRREPRGIVSTATAVASDITIGGLIRIAEVRSTATSVSNGRPAKRPMSVHTATISGLRIGDTVVCAAECDAKQATDALNLVAAGRVQFRVGAGSADQQLQQGSPGGALTAVQKSPQRRFSDRALAGDDTSEIPALEMIRYNDNFPWGTARQVFQFAAVATSANYNILVLPTGFAPPSGGAGGFEPGVDTPPGSGTATIPGTPGTPGVPGTPGTETAGASLAGSRSLAPADSGGIAGAVGDLLRGIGNGLRLVLGDWRQALLLFTAWLLLAQPVLLARRRQLLHRVQPL